MATVYSTLSKLPDPVAILQTDKLHYLDVDLIDKIKIAISKLKTTIRGKGHGNLELPMIHVLSRDKNFKDNQDAILCIRCDQWVHRKCNAMSELEY